MFDYRSVDIGIALKIIRKVVQLGSSWDVASSFVCSLLLVGCCLTNMSNDFTLV